MTKTMKRLFLAYGIVNAVAFLKLSGLLEILF